MPVREAVGLLVGAPHGQLDDVPNPRRLGRPHQVEFGRDGIREQEYLLDAGEGRRDYLGPVKIERHGVRARSIRLAVPVTHPHARPRRHETLDNFASHRSCGARDQNHGDLLRPRLPKPLPSGGRIRVSLAVAPPRTQPTFRLPWALEELATVSVAIAVLLEPRHLPAPRSRGQGCGQRPVPHHEVGGKCGWPITRRNPSTGPAPMKRL
jgi:hypothetical protein